MCSGISVCVTYTHVELVCATHVISVCAGYLCVHKSLLRTFEFCFHACMLWLNASYIYTYTHAQIYVCVYARAQVCVCVRVCVRERNCTWSARLGPWRAKTWLLRATCHMHVASYLCRMSSCHLSYLCCIISMLHHIYVTSKDLSSSCHLSYAWTRQRRIHVCHLSYAWTRRRNKTHEQDAFMHEQDKTHSLCVCDAFMCATCHIYVASYLCRSISILQHIYVISNVCRNISMSHHPVCCIISMSHHIYVTAPPCCNISMSHPTYVATSPCRIMCMKYNIKRV